MKVLGVNHLAVAHDQSGNLEKVLGILGINSTRTEEVKEQNVFVEFFAVPSQRFSLELLKPSTKDSVIQKYLDTRGPGLHHFCIEVDDVVEACNLLLSNNIRLIYPEAKLGAHGAKINFIHPKESGGILIEIAQYH